MKEIDPEDKVLLTWGAGILAIDVGAMIVDRSGHKDPTRTITQFVGGNVAWNVFSRPLYKRAFQALFILAPTIFLIINIHAVKTGPSTGGHLLLWLGTSWVFLGLLYAWRIGEARLAAAHIPQIGNGTR
jgi:hypothetical protein